jgi:TorA maturation chaperone TorD
MNDAPNESLYAQARSNAYQLFSRLFLNGLRAETLSVVQMIPELAAVTPQTLDCDHAAAQHYTLFGMNLFPLQSFWLDASGLAGGAETDRVAASYAECGYTPYQTDAAIDHISQQLACLAFLCAAEADALADQKTGLAQRIHHLQAHFLTQHLLRWLPPLVCALQRQDAPFYGALAELTLALSDAHLADAEATWMSLRLDSEPFVLPPAPALLDNAATTLRQLVNYFLRPACCGLLFTRHDLAQVGRMLRLPIGFAERETQFVNLLRAASRFETLPALFSALSERLQHDRKYYAAASLCSASLQAMIRVWQERLADSDRLLKELERTVQTQSVDRWPE